MLTTYLQLCLVLMGLWAIIYLYRRDLRAKLMQVGLVGGLAGLVSEHWYFQDYWRPPSLFGLAAVSLEDFLFGFTIVGISTTIFQVIFRKQSYRDTSQPERMYVLPVVVFGTIFMMLSLTTFWGLNSIFTSYISFGCIFLWMAWARKDLIIPNVLTGFLLALASALTYLVVFEHSFWQRYWLLYGTRYDKILFEVVPITELVWYLLLGLAAGGFYEFIRGYTLKSINLKSKREKHALLTDKS